MKEEVEIRKRRKISTIWLALLFLFASFLFLKPKEVFAQNYGFISGQVFEDLNINQTKDFSEEGLADWQVNLYQGNNLIQSKSTSSNGNYHFSDLGKGEYSVEIIAQKNWAIVGDRIRQISLNQGQGATVNFGSYKVKDNNGPGPYPFMMLHNERIKEVGTTSATLTWFTSHLTTVK